MSSRLLEFIANRVYSRINQYELEVSNYMDHCSFKDISSLNFKPIKIGQSWGNLFERAWFKATLKSSLSTYDPSLSYAYLIDVGGEGLIYTEDGKCITGITNKNSSYGIPPDKPGKWVVPIDLNQVERFFVDASCNDLFGYVQEGGRIQEASLAIIHHEWHKLYYDVEVLTDWAYGISEDGNHQPSKKTNHVITQNTKILQILEKIEFLLLSNGEPNLSQTQQLLADFYLNKTSQDTLSIYATGHAHLDIAWLWSISEGRRKAKRTFATAVHMMARYPNYIFGASQYQLFDWIKSDEPELFKSIQKKVFEGKFEPQGIFWVECDLNLPSLESLIRQIYYGKQFVKAHFNQDINYVWEPDVFGLTGALPQILIKSGIDVVLSQKLSQNRHNPLPYHSFKWRGIDGSVVLVHHFPEETYDSRMRPASLLKLYNQYKEKASVPSALMVFGVGDGGGGPGEEHLERYNRIHDLEPLPKVKMATVKTFIEHFKSYEEQLNTIDGELYFERHQGTYTTEVLNKIGNESMERLLCEYEQLCGWLYWFNDTKNNPSWTDNLWKEVLLYQFHDILPGSSIMPVYHQTRKRYAEMIHLLQEKIALLKSSFFKLWSITIPSVFNPTGHPRQAWVKVNTEWYYYDVKPFDFEPLIQKSYEKRMIQRRQMNNGRIQVKVDEFGSIVSILDIKSSYEYIDVQRLKPMWTIYHELAHEYAAWDFADDYRTGTKGHPQVLSILESQDGPLQQFIIKYKYNKSFWSLSIQLFEDIPWIKMLCDFDWKDINTSVKFHLPITIDADEATCHMQYGNIMRPTKNFDSLSLAKDEIYAHQFIDISDDSRGLALMSPQKYGYRVKNQSIEMTILRSQKKNGSELGYIEDEDYPEQHYGDLVEHQFEFGLYPHEGTNLIEVESVASSIKHPIWLTEDFTIGQSFEQALIILNDDQVAIKSIKQSYDQSGLILRVVELSGQNRCFALLSMLDIKQSYLCDMLENILEPLKIDNIRIKGFEVLTIKLMKGDS